MPLRIACTALLLAAPVAANPIAEMICAPTPEMSERLARQFGESRAAVGLRGPEQVMEVWTRDGGETWTLVVTYATGQSCIVAMGEDWQTLAPGPAPADPA